MRSLRRIIPLSALLFSVGVFAAEKDVAYYKAHPEEARAKYEECQKAIGELAAAGKIDEMMKLSEDPECNAADTVIKLYETDD